MARSEFNAAEQALRARADELEAEAKALRDQADASRLERDKQRPVKERLVFAAATRCKCGAGFAYDPTGEIHSPEKNPSPFRKPDAWECSDILLYYGKELSADEAKAALAAEHDGALPFTFYEIKSENQPSANGRTTRERIAPSAAA